MKPKDDDPLLQRLSEERQKSPKLDVYQMGELTRRHQELYPAHKSSSYLLIAVSSGLVAGLAALAIVALFLWQENPKEVSPFPEVAMDDSWIPLSAFSMNVEPGKVDNEPFSELHTRISNYRMVDSSSSHQFLMNRNESFNERLGAMKLTLFNDETL